MSYIGFDDIIDQLGTSLDTDLAPDANGACQMIIDENLAIQLEPSASEEHILIGSQIFELPPGKYRTDVLKQALIQNGASEPPLETLCYIQQNSTLALFRNLPTKSLTVEKLLDALSSFIATALDWKEALDAGHSAPAKTYLTKDAAPSPFDLK